MAGIDGIPISHDSHGALRMFRQFIHKLALFLTSLTGKSSGAGPDSNGTQSRDHSHDAQRAVSLNTDG